MQSQHALHRCCCCSWQPSTDRQLGTERGESGKHGRTDVQCRRNRVGRCSQMMMQLPSPTSHVVGGVCGCPPTRVRGCARQRARARSIKQNFPKLNRKKLGNQIAGKGATINQGTVPLLPGRATAHVGQRRTPHSRARSCDELRSTPPSARHHRLHTLTRESCCLMARSVAHHVVVPQMRCRGMPFFACSIILRSRPKPISFPHPHHLADECPRTQLNA